MTEDPHYAETIRRGIEAELKYEAATRKERAFEHTQLQAKGERIEARTNRLASRLGVDAQTARDLVGKRILQNESMYGKKDISVEEVDMIVGGYAQRVKPAGPTPVSTPATQVLAETIPPTTASTAAQAPPPTTTPPAPKTTMGDTDHPMDRLRMAVKQSAYNMRSSGL